MQTLRTTAVEADKEFPLNPSRKIQKATKDTTQNRQSSGRDTKLARIQYGATRRSEPWFVNLLSVTVVAKRPGLTCFNYASGNTLHAL